MNETLGYSSWLCISLGRWRPMAPGMQQCRNTQYQTVICLVDVSWHGGYSIRAIPLQSIISCSSKIIIYLIIDREAWEIIYLVASVRLSIHLSICPSTGATEAPVPSVSDRSHTKLPWNTKSIQYTHKRKHYQSVCLSISSATSIQAFAVDHPYKYQTISGHSKLNMNFFVNINLIENN